MSGVPTSARLVPALHLDSAVRDGAATTAAAAGSAHEQVPGRYSPRPALTTTTATTTATAAAKSSSNVTTSTSAATTLSPLLASHHPHQPHGYAPPHHLHHGASMASLAEEAAVGISDPDLDTEPHTSSSSSRSRHTSQSPPLCAATSSAALHDADATTTVATTGASSTSSTTAAAAAVVTSGRAGVVSVDATAGSERGASPSCEAAHAVVADVTAATAAAADDHGTAALRALCAHAQRTPFASRQVGTAADTRRTRAPPRLAAMALREVYVHGRPLRRYLARQEQQQQQQQQQRHHGHVTRLAASTRAAAPRLRNRDTRGGDVGDDDDDDSACGDSSRSSGAVVAAARRVRFAHDAMQAVTAMDAHDEQVAVGDRAGRLVLLQRRAMTRAQQAHYQRVANGDDADDTSSDNNDNDDDRRRVTQPRTRAPYVCFASACAYTPCIDTLYSGEVAPAITAVALLPPSSSSSPLSPQPGTTACVLCANEKLPKLYMASYVREAAAPFRAVDKMDTRTIGPLTAASRASTTTLRCVAQYAHGHESNIHSVCVLSHGSQFVTADEVAVRLWCVDYPDSSLDVYDVRTAPSLARGRVTAAGSRGGGGAAVGLVDDDDDDMAVGGDASECLRNVRVFAAQQPWLLFLTTTAGQVRVLDTRQSLRWGKQVAQVFVTTARRSSGSGGYAHDVYSNNNKNSVDDDHDGGGDACSVSDCALSPCGRYIAGRDDAGVCLWDVRKAAAVAAAATSTLPRHASGVVRRWSLPPCDDDDDVERCDVQFVSPAHVCTGGGGGSSAVLYTIDVLHTPSATRGGDAGVAVYTLPSLDGVARAPRGGCALTARSLRDALPSPPTRHDASKGGDDNDGGGAGACVSLLTRPVMSPGGVCGLLASCGQAVVQFDYTLTT